MKRVTVPKIINAIGLLQILSKEAEAKGDIDFRNEVVNVTLHLKRRAESLIEKKLLK